jgi:hypothetical protein
MEQFSGLKLDASRDLRVGFGDYLEATVPNTNNTMAARTEGCLALLPTGNLQGSVHVWTLRTKQVKVRDQFRVLPTPDIVIAHLNKLAASDGYSRWIALSLSMMKMTTSKMFSSSYQHFPT